MGLTEFSRGLYVAGENGPSNTAGTFSLIELEGSKFIVENKCSISEYANFY